MRYTLLGSIVAVASLVWTSSSCDQLPSFGGGAEPGGSAAPGSSGTSSSAASAAASAPGSAAASAAASAEPLKADPSRLVLKGKAIQGGLLHAKVDKATRGIKFPGHRVIISPEGEFLIAFYRNAPKEEKLTVTFPDGAVLEHLFLVEQRTFEDDKIDGLPEHFVRLDADTKKKVHESNQRIDEIRKRYTKEAHYNDGFVWPCTGKITSRYGQKRILNGTDGGIHWGVDIAAVLGTRVLAPAGGRVVFAEKDIPLAGHTLLIDHGHGLTSTFIHLGSFAKKVGDEVKQGDVVATVGLTGRTNGPHLDWRMNLFETRIDPELLAPPMGGAAP